MTWNMLVHTCYLHTTDQRLNFDGGSKTFTVGKILTGATSHATGTVKSQTVSTGSWAGSNAAGYLVLSNVTGTFQNNELLSDTGTIPGAAVADGANFDYKDPTMGRETQTASATATSCRFMNAKAPAGNTEYGWSGRFPVVWFEAGTVISEGQELTTTATGFVGTFAIQWPPLYAPTAPGGVHHITCALKAVS